MEAVIRKWGNSLAVRLPVSVMSEAHLSLGQPVSITAKEGRIIIEAVHRVEYSLEALVAGITAKNMHEEIGFGPPVGRELL